MVNPTLLDIVKANGVDPVTGLVDETIYAHPEIKMGAARTIKGINYKTLVRTALPNTQGSFRQANQGVTASKSSYENRLVECYLENPRVQVDRAIADAYEDGPQAYIAMETQGLLEGEMQGLCRQFYYGPNSKDGGGAVIANAYGFPGLIDSYDANNMVVDAAGTTANTGSSVWLVKFGPQHTQWCWGLNGEFSFSQPTLFPVDDGTGQNKTYMAYVSEMLARPGLQVGSIRSVVRIKKLTADAGKGLTDALLNKALSLFVAGLQPDVVFMTRRSLNQLQASRTTYNPLGQPAPYPKEIAGIGGEGIPIALTDAITNTEPLTL